MRICVITSPFGDLPPNALGAVEKLFHQLAGEWTQSGHDVTFVCAGGGDNAAIHYKRIGRYKRTGRTLTDLPIDLWYSIKAVLAIPKCDVLVCNTFWSPILAPFVRWKYKKLVYGVHRYPKGQFGLYRFVHSFICVSTAIGNALKAQCKSAAPKVCVVCNPIDTTIFKPQTSEDKTVSADYEIKIVYTGRIAEEKGVVHLAKAVNDLAADDSVLKGRKVRLLLAGPWETSVGGGGESYVARIRTAFKSAELLGPIYEPAKIAELIRSAGVYCYPTIAERGEAFGIAPLEAMACGVPVVLPRFACFSDYARDGENCLMYDRPEQLPDALRRIFRDESLASRLAMNAAGSVADFSIQKIAAFYIEAFGGTTR